LDTIILITFNILTFLTHTAEIITSP